MAARFFRRTFELPEGKSVVRAVLHLTVDDKFTAYLNGELVGSHADWMTGKEFTDVARLLRPGKNVLAVRGENAPGPKDANPAGLSCDLEIVLSGDVKMAVRSDDAWRCSRDEAASWQKTDFDDRDWAKVRIAAKFGEGPWGRTLGAAVRDEYLTPYAAGVPGVVRIVYLPRAQAVTVRKLEPDVQYAVSTFDPTTGRREEIGAARPDADGSWTASPPVGMAGDWVLILDAKP